PAPLEVIRARAPPPPGSAPSAALGSRALVRQPRGRHGGGVRGGRPWERRLAHSPLVRCLGGGGGGGAHRSRAPDPERLLQPRPGASEPPRAGEDSPAHLDRFAR